MYRDEIVDEVRKVRETYAAEFNFDPDRIFNDAVLKQSQRSNLVRIGSSSRRKVFPNNNHS